MLLYESEYTHKWLSTYNQHQIQMYPCDVCPVITWAWILACAYVSVGQVASHIKKQVDNEHSI